MADVLGAFEQAVLMAVVRLREEAYGRAIIRGVSESLGRDVAVGAVYATLERLQQKALVTSRLGEGTPVRDGRARRYFTISTQGVLALNEAKAVMEQIWDGAEWPLRCPA